MISFPYSKKFTSTIDSKSPILSFTSVVCNLVHVRMVLIRGLIDALADQSTPPKIGATVLIRQVPNECMLYYRAGMTSHTRILPHGNLSSARVNHAAYCHITTNRSMPVVVLVTHVRLQSGLYNSAYVRFTILWVYAASLRCARPHLPVLWIFQIMRYTICQGFQWRVMDAPDVGKHN